MTGVLPASPMGVGSLPGRNRAVPADSVAGTCGGRLSLVSLGFFVLHPYGTCGSAGGIPGLSHGPDSMAHRSAIGWYRPVR
jgi:hypothetical protein